MSSDRDKTISTAIDNVCAQWTYASSRRKLYLDWCAGIRQSWLIEKVFAAAMFLEHAPVLADLERIKRECTCEVPMPKQEPEMSPADKKLTAWFMHNLASTLGAGFDVWKDTILRMAEELEHYPGKERVAADLRRSVAEYEIKRQRQRDAVKPQPKRFRAGYVDLPEIEITLGQDVQGGKGWKQHDYTGCTESNL